MKLESKFQSEIIKQIEHILRNEEDYLILKNDEQYIQGIPDLVVFYKEKYAFLETKRTKTSSYRPNQPYYLNKINKMSYAASINQDNKETILNELCEAFGISR